MSLGFVDSDARSQTTPAGPVGLVLVVLAVVVPFLHIVYYVAVTASPIPMRDDLYLMAGGVLESYLEGSLSFQDVWRSSGVHRNPAYALLMVANARWLQLQTWLPIALIPLLMLLSVLLTLRTIMRTTEDRGTVTGMICLVTVPILFTLAQQECLNFPYSLVFQMPLAIAIPLVLGFESVLRRGSWADWTGALVATTIAFLVTGQGIFPVTAALALTLGAYATVHRKSLTPVFWRRVAALGSYYGLLFASYVWNLEERNYFPGTTPSLGPLFADPPETIRFALGAFGASVLSLDAVKMFLPQVSLPWVGAVVVMAQLGALSWFFRYGVHRKTFLPFFFVIHTFLFIAMMTFGRFSFGGEYAMSSRYICVSAYGVATVVWMGALAAREAGRRFKTAIAIMVGVVWAGMILSTHAEWRIQPHRLRYFDRQVETAKNLDSASDAELAIFQERPEIVRASLELLRRHHLSIFADATHGKE